MAPDAIVGRDAERAAIGVFLDAASEGAGALLLEGEAGIGKTTLWHEAVRVAASRGMHVLSTRPGETDARLTFVGLADLLAGVDESVLEQVPDPQRRALDVALLRSDADTQLPDQRHVSMAMLSVLRALSASVSVVVAVDDLQWLDRPSTDVLLFAFRRLDRESVRLAGGVRVEPGRSWGQDLAGALGERRVERIRLGPLSLSAIHDVLLAQLGNSFPRPTLVRIEQAAAGNPFYALELGRALLESGEPTSGAAPLPVTENLRELIERRLRRLPAATRAELLRLSAVAQSTATQVDAGALAAAEDAGLVSLDRDGRAAFSHPLYASAVYGAAPPGRRRRVHRELADTVADPEERARHLALATVGRDSEVALQLDIVARQVRARGAFGSAAELTELALRLTPTDDELMLRRTVAFAGYLFHAGDDARARELLEGALAVAPEGDSRCEALVLLSEILWGDGEWERGIGLCEEALAAARNRSLRARAHTQLAAMGDLNIPKAAEHARAALDLLDEAADPIAYAKALVSAVQWEFCAGKEPDFESVERALALQEVAGSWEISTAPAGLARNADDFETARARYESYLRRAEEEDDELRRCIVLAHLATLECWIGDLPAAELHARESLEIVEQTAQLAFRCVALHACATVDAYLGRTDAARASIEEQLELLRDQPDPVLEVMARALAGFVDLPLGNLREADASFMRASELLDGMGWREPAPFRFQADQIETAILLGELDRAETLLAVLDERNRVFSRPWLSATSSRCLGLLLAARGDLEGAERELERARVEHERLDMPLELGRTLLCVGQIRRRRRKVRVARESLSHAVEIFEGVGAEVWAETARSELARTHVRQAPKQLTPTEERIAELAASGLTNRAIGERLFVSPKTVEANLARVYRKLDIRSRAELGRAFADREQTVET